MTVETDEILRSGPRGSEGLDFASAFPAGVVVWGLRGTRDTFRHIHRHFFETARALGVPSVWTKDSIAEAHVVKPGMLVLAIGIAAEHLPHIEGASYCLHNFDEDAVEEFDPATSIRLQVYTDGVRECDLEQWGPATFFDRESRMLYQPWGTPLRADRFLPPTTGKLPVSFWMGSVWNNEANQGNLNEIAELRHCLKSHGIRFIHIISAPDRMHMAAIRASRIAPAIAGGWQADKGYLPCRAFKNISYGQLGITNVSRVNEILGDSAVPGETINEMVENALALSATEREERTRAQQEAIARLTYFESLNSIARALERVSA